MKSVIIKENYTPDMICAPVMLTCWPASPIWWRHIDRLLTSLSLSISLNLYLSVLRHKLNVYSVVVLFVYFFPVAFSIIILFHLFTVSHYLRVPFHYLMILYSPGWPLPAPGLATFQITPTNIPPTWCLDMRCVWLTAEVLYRLWGGCGVLTCWWLLLVGIGRKEPLLYRYSYNMKVVEGYILDRLGRGHHHLVVAIFFRW